MRPGSLRRGSLPLEAAIVLPGFLLIGLAIVFGILSIRTGIFSGIALEKAGRTISLMGPIVDSIGIDRIARLSGAESGKDTVGVISAIVAEAGPDFVASFSTGAILPLVFDKEFRNASSGHALESGLIVGDGAGRWATTCESRLSEDLMVLTVEYRLRTPFGNLLQRRRLAIALWMSGDGTLDDSGGENVWNLGNLERGRKIRSRFGGNLPIGYPVISSMRNGTATLIHSMDLSLYGWSDASEAETELHERISDLAAFDGTSRPWGADSIDIRAGTIERRTLLLVIPTNTDDARFSSLLQRSLMAAENSGVLMTVVRYQEHVSPVDKK